jgi:hypothetical protein
LSRICKELEVDFGDIVSYVPDEENTQKNMRICNTFVTYAGV